MSRRKEKVTEKPKKEFDEVMLEVRRVTRVTTGWRQLSFRAIILVWNRKGKIGVGISKWADVQIAVSKATHDAYKNVIDVPLTDRGTIPYQIQNKYKGAQVKLIPAAPGTGLKAWSSVRTVLELVGCTNILSKIMWSPNKLNNAIAAVNALGSFKVWKFPERIKKADASESNDETVAETAVSTPKTESEKEVAVDKADKKPVAPKAQAPKAQTKKATAPKTDAAKPATPKKKAE